LGGFWDINKSTPFFYVACPYFSLLPPFSACPLGEIAPQKPKKNFTYEWDEKRDLEKTLGNIPDLALLLHPILVTFK
jgi:hypothetical protein